MSLLKRSNYLMKSLFSVLIIFTFAVSINATQYKLFRTKTTGNVVILTARAKIVQVQRTNSLKSYSIWRNGSAFINISIVKNSKNNNKLQGVLPAGRYILRVLGGNATIILDTVYRPFKVVLWGRLHKLVKPLYDGNKVILTSPATITSATYNGTLGMGIFLNNGTRAFLHYLSPHNRGNPGPKVIGGTGGKTLVGQALPIGQYKLIPGQATRDGIVYGQVVFTIN